MKYYVMALAAASMVYLAVTDRAVSAQSNSPQSNPDGPVFTTDGQLTRPLNYREWVYLTSGLGMTYGPAAPGPNRPPLFDNVFVNRRAYREFLQTGAWPDQTILILEIRRSESAVSIDNGGRSQGAVAAIEAAVKDRARFPDGGWGYFTFGNGANPAERAAPLPQSASCYACHKANAAVEQTFVQFYPTLMDVARQKGTVRADYDPTRKL
jgi:hypothetical protein